MIRYFFNLAIVFLMSAGSVFATIQSARFSTRPSHVFLNQPFELYFEVEVTAGCEIQDIQISHMPIEELGLSLQPLVSLPKITKNSDGKAIDVLRFSAPAQAAKAGERTFSSRLHCTLVERSTGGFFSFMQSRNATIEIAPFTLRIQTLPETGRPADFSGAIGTFQLNAKIEPQTAQPGDLLKLLVDIHGDGNLNGATLAIPHAHGFKVYPIKERLREASRLQTEQIFIPQTTNATTLGAIALTYFNPVTQHYECAQAGPFTITFTHEAATQTNDTVRIISTDSPSPAETGAHSPLILETVNLNMRQALPLIILCGATLLACFCFFQFKSINLRLAILLAIVILVSGAIAAHRFWQKPQLATRTLGHCTEVKFAPTSSSPVLFKLQPGTTVIPLESAGTWLRIDANGKRGWIAAHQLNEPEPKKEKQP